MNLGGGYLINYEMRDTNFNHRGVRSYCIEISEFILAHFKNLPATITAAQTKIGKKDKKGGFPFLKWIIHSISVPLAQKH